MRRARHAAVLVAIVLPLALGGCKKKKEGKLVVDAYRSQVEARFSIARKIGTDLQTMPELAKDGASLPYGKVTLRGPSESLVTDTAMMEEDRTLLFLNTPGRLTLLRAGQLRSVDADGAHRLHRVERPRPRAAERRQRSRRQGDRERRIAIVVVA